MVFGEVGFGEVAKVLRDGGLGGCCGIEAGFNGVFTGLSDDSGYCIFCSFVCCVILLKTGVRGRVYGE